MNIMIELRDLAMELAARVSIPPIMGMVLPPYFSGGQPKACEFMALALEGGAAGISYVLIPDDWAERYRALRPESFIGTRAETHAEMFGCDDPAKNMIGLAAVNAICQHVMRTSAAPIDSATDSLGLMNVQEGDRIGMVGFFRPLLKYIQEVDAELVVVEKNEALIDTVPNLHITLDATELNRCNKVLCTSTVVLNNTIDDVLAQCTQAEHITVLGPTAGYYPDPLFTRGVDVVGSRYVHDGELLLRLIEQGESWGDATQKLCFQRSTYRGIPSGLTSLDVQ